VFVVDGAVSALDAASGRRLWRAALGEYLPSCLVGDAARVIAGTERIVAFDAASGTERWRFEPRAHTALACPALAGERLVTGTVDGHVIALDTRDALAAADRQRWATRIGDAALATPAVVRGVTIEGGVVYVAAEQWRVASGHAVMGWIAALDVESGRLLWQTPFGAPEERRAASARPLVTAAGVVVVPDALGNTLVAVDARDGAPRWTFRGERNAIGFATTPATIGDTLYAASGDAHVYALRADEGALVWRAALPAGAISASVCGERVFADFQGRAGSITARGRVLARQLDDDGDFVSAGLAVAAGRLYAAGGRAVYKLDCALE
jgi:outer membrane protein assembly factor BamB